MSFYLRRCRRFRNGKCGARLITIEDKIINETNRIHTHDVEETAKNIYVDDQYATNHVKYIYCNETD